MEFKDTVNCGKALRVGVGIVPAIKEGDEEINGALFAEGPVVFGEPSEFDHAGATMMVDHFPMMILIVRCLRSLLVRLDLFQRHNGFVEGYLLMEISLLQDQLIVFPLED